MPFKDSSHLWLLLHSYCHGALFLVLCIGSPLNRIPRRLVSWTVCRNHWPHPLPAIPALVVRVDERPPGSGYYPIAHPVEHQEGGEVQALVAWWHQIQEA